MTHYVILGNSAAGLTAIDAIRQRDNAGPITVISREADPAYSRVALPYILSREKELRQVTLREEDYYKVNRIELISGVGASGLDSRERTVRLEDGRSLPYDKLLIATGSVPVVVPVPGIEEADVCYHWTLADTRLIEAKARQAKSCFVIGAGFISLLTLSALAKVADLKYTVVEVADQVMPQLLDRQAGQTLERVIRKKGIEVRLGDQPSAIERRRDGGYEIFLKGGEALGADMIICGAGVRPNIDFLEGSALEIDRGVLTNECQETNLPDVYAAGDCAEGFDFLSGRRAVHAIWPTATDQGRVAGANMAGDHQTYPGSLSWSVSELFGLACASLGQFRTGDSLEPLVFQNASANLYRKLLLADGRIAGAVVLGGPEHIQELGVVQAMIRRRSDVSRWRHLLRGEHINYAMLAYESVKR